MQAIASFPAFFSETVGEEGGEVVLSAEESHHAVRVLRLRAGDGVVLLNGRGQAAEGWIVDPHPCRAVIGIGRLHQFEPPSPAITLWCAPPHTSDRLHWLVEKGVELGVDRFQWVITQRTVRHRVKLEKLQKTAIAAAKQSHNPFLPEILPPTPLSRLLALSPSSPHALRLMGRRNSKRLAASLPDAPPIAVIWAVGPEGGFTAEEEDLLIRSGFQPASVGPYVVRVETAAIAAVAVIRSSYC